eukprot:GHVT01002098.1.p1 GENE.GHVT01002098.1~~GHVT01002098.1.p1  ORF type:complete len:329 (-),score=76.45 GHVT01002098.1:288-1274(-)
MEQSEATWRPSPPPPPLPPPAPQFFVDSKRGEIAELRQLLRQLPLARSVAQQRATLTRVLGYMTLGIDISQLFSEMIMISSTTDLVQKKMVFLYLTNYAESNAELSILAINSLQKDCRDADPSVRGLALRSLCSLRLPGMTEYLEAGLRQGLGDGAPYVRRTAVMGCVKLFALSKDPHAADWPKDKHQLPQLMRHKYCDIIAKLEKLLYDSNPQVTKKTKSQTKQNTHTHTHAQETAKQEKIIMKKSLLLMRFQEPLPGRRLHHHARLRLGASGPHASCRLSFSIVGRCRCPRLSLPPSSPSTRSWHRLEASPFTINSSSRSSIACAR